MTASFQEEMSMQNQKREQSCIRAVGVSIVVLLRLHFITLFKNHFKYKNCIDGIVISMLDSSTVDHEFAA
jgi:hypothetical protein